ncbi:MAG: hypothetical protein ACYTEQ_01385 [Planctomycetota bacterium]|jgi:hypothetical protein
MGAKDYRLSHVEFGGAADKDLGGHSTWSINPAMTNLIAASDGEINPSFVAGLEAAPTITGTTSHIAEALNLSSIPPLFVESTQTYTSFSAWFRPMVAGGLITADGTATHIKTTSGLGLFVIQSISAAQGSAASLNWQYTAATADGITSPLVQSTAAVTREAALGVIEQFTVGKATVNGTDVSMTNFDLTYNIEVSAPLHDGDAFPSAVYVGGSIQPVIEFTTTDMALLPTLPPEGVAQGATDSIFYLRKITEGGLRVADGTEEHISFTVDEGFITQESASATQGGGPGEARFKLQISDDGTNPMLSIDTTAAIV